MQLREWDWAKESYVEVEHPDAIIKEFVDWFRLNKQWRERDDMAEMVFRRWKHFERDLTEAKDDAARAAVPGPCTATTATGNRCKNTVDVVDGLCHIHRRTLATV